MARAGKAEILLAQIEVDRQLKPVDELRSSVDREIAAILPGQLLELLLALIRRLLRGHSDDLGGRPPLALDVHKFFSNLGVPVIAEGEHANQFLAITEAVETAYGVASAIGSTAYRTDA